MLEIDFVNHIILYCSGDESADKGVEEGGDAECEGDEQEN